MDANEYMLRPWESGFNLPESFNMVSLLLERHLEGSHAERTAVIFQNDDVTYRQLGCMTNKIGNGLIHMGIEPGERVILLLHDRPEFIALFLAAMKIGAVPVPINMLATTADLEYFIRDSQATAVVMESEMHAKIKHVLSDARCIKTVIVHGEAIPGTADLAQLIDSAADRLFEHGDDCGEGRF